MTNITRLPFPVLTEVAHDSQANFEAIAEHLDTLNGTAGGLGSAAFHDATDFAVNTGIIPIPCAAQPNAVGGTWACFFDTTVFASTLARNVSNGQFDAFRWLVPLSAGTWQLDWGTQKDVDRAMVTWDMSFDGGISFTAIGTYDGYAATTATVLVSIPGIVVPVTPSRVSMLRARVLTRNGANTTGWTMAFSTLALMKQG